MVVSRHKMVVQAAARLAFAVGVILVIALSLLPGPALPPMGFSDKLQHAVAYALLAAAGCASFPSRFGTVVTICGLIVLGGLLEIAQGFTPTREPSVADWTANIVGIGVVYLCARWIRLRWHPARG